MRIDFAGFYESEAPGLVRSLALAIGDPSLAEDAVAEALARAWSRWAEVRTHPRPTAWVMRVALNESRSRFRRRRVERRKAPVVARPDVAPEGDTDEAHVWEAVRQLPERQRTLIALRYIADLPQAEIADVLGISPGTVASGLNRARHQLEKALSPTYQGGAHMIEDQDLRGLREGGPPISLRPVATVMRRGTRLRRRRYALRAAGVTSVVGGLVGTGLVVLNGRSGDGAGVEVAVGSTTTSDLGSEPPPPPPDCDFTQALEPVTIPPGDVPDELRVRPTWTPEGAEISSASGSLVQSNCPDTAPAPAEYALILRARTGRSDRGPNSRPEIVLRGPLPYSLAETWGEAWGVGQEPTELRSGDATRVDPSYGDDVGFAWTEPDDWSWEINGYGVDEATVRAVAEGLELDSSPEGDEPAAALASEDVPDGFDVVWQTQGPATPSPNEWTTWSVVVGDPDLDTASATGLACYLDVDQHPGQAPPDAVIDGDTVTVNDQTGVWRTVEADKGPTGYTEKLTWELSPGVWASADCITRDADGFHSLPVATLVRFAESVAPIPPDQLNILARTYDLQAAQPGS